MALCADGMNRMPWESTFYSVAKQGWATFETWYVLQLTFCIDIDAVSIRQRTFSRNKDAFPFLAVGMRKFTRAP